MPDTYSQLSFLLNPVLYLKISKILISFLCESMDLETKINPSNSAEGWQPTPVFLPGKSHGQRSLSGYSLWSCKESDLTQQLNNNSYLVPPFCTKMVRDTEKNITLFLKTFAVRKITQKPYVHYYNSVINYHPHFQRRYIRLS